MKESFQSSGMFFSYMIRFTNSDIAVTVSLSPALIIPTITPDGPSAFPYFIILMAPVTIFSVTNIAGPSTAAELFREFLSQRNSTFKSL